MSDSNDSRDAKDFRDLVLQGFWLDLKDHQERGAIVIVHPTLDLAVVGRAISLDEARKVQDWILAGKLTRPTPEQLSAWNEMQAKEFQFLIAQPYVLIQEAAH